MTGALPEPGRAGRIAGVVGSQGSVPSLAPAVALMRGRGQIERRLAVPGAELAWCGLGSPRAAEVDDCLAVVDGTFFNLREIVAEGDEAHAVIAMARRGDLCSGLARVNGDFALAVHDSRSRTTWLARDRFGVKPLYYTRAADGLAFASRLAGLLALPGADRRPNRAFIALFAACHYRYFDNAPDESPYASVAQLPPSHVLVLRDGRITVERWWALDDGEDLSGDAGVLAERYRALLLDAVAVRLRGAGRPGFMLSGGMDSSSVFGCAVKLTDNRQHAFSSTYSDGTFDESEDIAGMARVAAADWHRVPVDDPDMPAIVERMVTLNDEPVATATWLAHYLLCERAAADGFETLFGGLGGDELNAGEYEHFIYHFADLKVQARAAEYEREVDAWAVHHDHPVYRKGPAVAEELLRRLVDLSTPGRCLPDRRRIERYADVLEPGWLDLRTFEPVMEHPFRSYLKNRTWQDLSRETIPCCLRAEDRHASACGLERRLPFLDYRLVELMFRIGGELKYQKGVTKHLLRCAMRGILPEATRTRVKKTGWNAPAHVWFAGRGREWLHDIVRSRSFYERGLWNVARVEAIIEEHERIVSGGLAQENHMMFLWQLVNLETWLRGPSSAPAVKAGGQA